MATLGSGSMCDERSDSTMSWSWKLSPVLGSGSTVIVLYSIPIYTLSNLYLKKGRKEEEEKKRKKINKESRGDNIIGYFFTFNEFKVTQ